LIRYAPAQAQQTKVLDATSNKHLVETETLESSGAFGDAGTSVVDATSVSVRQAFKRALDKRFTDSSKVAVDSSLEDFLSRPFPLASGVFSSTDGPTTFTEFEPFRDILSNAPQNYKFAGKYMVRADLRIRLQVNANRFQQGRYILAWLPTGGAITGSTGYTAWMNMHRHCKTQITQLPHVELDLASESEVVLEVPYVSAYLGYPQCNKATGTNFGDIGAVFLYPYAPLVSTAGSSTASYSIWVSFENVDYSGVAVPQMDVQEAEMQKDGPVSGTLKKVSQSAGILSRIPFLSGVASTTAWAADIFAGAARVWGWSRPGDLTHVTRVKTAEMPYLACTDGTDTAMPLALFKDNHVGVAPGFAGTDLDEMSFDYIKSISAFVTSVNWTTSQNRDQILLNSPVSPIQPVDTVLNSVTMKNHPPVSYLASMFQYWRGGITYTVKIVKTEFHSGRLLIAFNPQFYAGSSPTITAANSFYTLREILDIREKREVKFTIPWQYATNWALNTENTGYFVISVLDPLVAPATVSSTIQLLVEVNGAEDFSVSVPIPNSNFRVIAPAEYQAGIPTELLAENLGSSSLPSSGAINEEFCTGEKIQSIRSFLKKYDCFGYTSAHAVTVYPFYTPTSWVTSTTVGLSPDSNDYYGLWGMCYALHRGGMRIKAVPEEDQFDGQPWAHVGLDKSTSNNLPYCMTEDAAATDEISHQRGLLKSITKLENAGIDIMIPQYAPSHSRLALLESGNAAYFSTWDKIVKSRVVARIGYSHDVPMWYYRCGADDLSFGRFVSVPPVVSETRPAVPSAS